MIVFRSSYCVSSGSYYVLVFISFRLILNVIYLINIRNFVCVNYVALFFIGFLLFIVLLWFFFSVEDH